MTSVNDRTYTRYQKDVIKAVSRLIGTRPFRYEKTQSNHLKLTIEGVDKPIFTSSTPSDRRSLYNVLSQIQSMLRTPIDTLTLPLSDQDAGAEEEQTHTYWYEKIKDRLIRMFRNQVAEIENKERVLIEQTNTVDGVLPFRKQWVKQAINDKLKMHKSSGYFKTSEVRSLSKELMHHLNFMLPDLATYAAQLKVSAESEIDPDMDVTMDADTQHEPMADTDTAQKKEKVPLCSLQNIHYTMRNQHNKKRIKPVSTHMNTPEPTSEHRISSPLVAVSEEEPTLMSQLLSLSTRARVKAFKTLTTTQANALLADLHTAIEEKHDDDLHEVIALIQRKGLQLDEIAACMEKKKTTKTTIRSA